MADPWDIFLTSDLSVGDVLLYKFVQAILKALPDGFNVRLVRILSKLYDGF